MHRALGIAAMAAAMLAVTWTVLPAEARADANRTPAPQTGDRPVAPDPAAPAVLLEKGIYLEETAGDLDAAVKVYQKVVEQAAAGRKYAAEAQYRLGSCYLKQKKIDLAVETLRGLAQLYPDQKELLAKADNAIAAARGRLSEAEVAKIAEEVVTVISTCAETDPRVAESLARLKGLKDESVSAAVAKYLDSNKATFRRSAIYVLWKGPMKDISAAVAGLKKALAHEEDLTRGMAAMTMGARKVAGSLESLSKMALEDKSGFARRAAAYALGLLGDPAAKPALEKMLKDPEPLVRNNAEAALTMLAQAASIGPYGTDLADNEALDLDTGKKLQLQTVWPDEFDVAWDNDMGGVLMVNPKGGKAKIMAIPEAKDLIDAREIAVRMQRVLENSQEKGVPATRSRFAAVLTNQGRIAVIQVTEFTKQRGVLQYSREGPPRLPDAVIGFIVADYLKSHKAAQEKGLHANAHIYGVDGEFNSYWGGFINYRNESNQPASGSIHVGNFGPERPDFYLSDEQGQAQDYEVREQPSGRGARWGLWWKPAKPVAPGAFRLLGYLRKDIQKLPVSGGNAALTMQNHFGSPVLETFYLAVPVGMKVLEGGQGPKATLQATFGTMVVYAWQAQVPANTTHKVEVVLQAPPGGFRAGEEARARAEAFLAAALAGREKEAAGMTDPASAVARQVADFRGIVPAEGKAVGIQTVLADERDALAITSAVKGDRGRVGRLLIALKRSDGPWMVRDVDLKAADRADADLAAFAQKHPNARRVLPGPLAPAGGTRSAEVYIMGDVERPGVYSITDRAVTIKMMLAAAGYRGEPNAPAQATLIRRQADGNESRLPFTIPRLFSGQQEDVVLQPNDLLFVGAAPGAVERRQGTRYFVQIVVGKEAITFEGQKTTLKELPDLLAKVPNRPQTVLCVGTESDQVTVKENDQVFAVAAKEASRLGFEYVSYVGVQPLGSKGRPPQDLAVTASGPAGK